MRRAAGLVSAEAGVEAEASEHLGELVEIQEAGRIARCRWHRWDRTPPVRPSAQAPPAPGTRRDRSPAGPLPRTGLPAQDDGQPAHGPTHSCPPATSSSLGTHTDQASQPEPASRTAPARRGERPRKRAESSSSLASACRGRPEQPPGTARPAPRSPPPFPAPRPLHMPALRPSRSVPSIWSTTALPPPSRCPERPDAGDPPPPPPLGAPPLPVADQPSRPPAAPWGRALRSLREPQQRVAGRLPAAAPGAASS